ncbi:MAG: FAD-binding oxidoreductase, partial [Longimicrobiales bacterium]
MSSHPALRLVDGGPADTTAAPVVRPAGPAYESWGRWPRRRHAGVVTLDWSCAPPDLGAIDGPLLAYGLGRSYGDVCLNEGGVLLDTKRMCRIIQFDRESGLLHCDAGLSLSDLLDVVVPHGWFPPVTPGTRHITIGGAIANDVHGKNHHWAGTFGCHVLRLELLRSDGRRLWCSPAENADLFAATIGGLGLTGLI